MNFQPPISYGNSEFGALTVLRGLILKIQDPKKWKTLMKLEAHNEIRKTLPLWRENTINVVDIILRDYDLADVFTAEEAHTVNNGFFHVMYFCNVECTPDQKITTH